MAAWLLIAPPDRFTRPPRENFLERIDRDGRPVVTPHAILGKRFASAGIARRWAAQFGELLDEYTVGRR